MATPSQAKRVGIWIRVSTEDQVRGESPEHHERRARLYAEAKGWDVLEVYRLDALSGKTVKDLPGTKRMLRDIERGHITGLIFSKLARLARNTRELLDFADLFRQHDADLVSLAESIDTSTPAGRLFYTMVAAMAQWEREEIAERVAASVPIRARMGKSLGGQPPFGYAWQDGKLVPNADEAPVRRLLYQLFQEHRRKKTVARLLNERGYRTRNGSLFTDTTVGRLIEDPTAKGLRRANYTRSDDSSRAWKRKPEADWVFHPVEAIVSSELWEECNAVLAGRKGSRPKRPTIEVRHLFAGLAWCQCGTKMYVVSNSPKYVCQQCRNKIPIEDLEAIFHEQLRSFFFTPGEIERHVSAFAETLKDKEEQLAALERERSRLAQEADKLYALYLADALDQRGFAERNRPLAARSAQLDDELPALQAELDFLRISELSQSELMESARDLYKEWPTLGTAEKRQIVETITERIVVSNDGIEIDLLYAPALPPSTGSTGTPPASSGGFSSSEDSSQTHGKSATRPCPCGWRGAPPALGKACRCTPEAVARYQGRLSGPLLDRIDLQVEVLAAPAAELLAQPAGEPSAVVARRVAAAAGRQRQRQGVPNAWLEPAQIDAACALEGATAAFARQAAERLGWSGRRLHRCLKLARTIADLAGAEAVATAHVAEALQLQRVI